MEFYQVIENRKSVKKFKSSKLQKDKIEKIINSAMRGPSWKNNTSYKFILVEDMEKKNMLATAIMNKTDEVATAIKDAPMVAVVIANPQKSGTVENKEYYLVDSAIAMEHFILAATAEGYGTCWVGAIDEDKVKDALCIPKEFKVVALTPVGEAEEINEHNEKKDIKDYVFLNCFGKPY